LEATKWDPKLVGDGLQLLDLSAKGSELSGYHLEAAIAAVHATAPSVKETNWGEIVSLYDTLMTIRPTPIVELNRAIAIGQRDGPKRGIEALHAIAESDRLAKYPFYHAAFAEFKLQSGQAESARAHFEQALKSARNRTERQFFERRVIESNQ
jgi:predicted RNA polymerase sigma factor